MIPFWIVDLSIVSCISLQSTIVISWISISNDPLY
jgi:hypothetical protein